ncbi:MAG TPA: hypothetical protein VNP95_13205, partial [Thermomicrobiales bacterium]|nr:hypothetical protein [Thermomicrobiales bacterium]
SGAYHIGNVLDMQAFPDQDDIDVMKLATRFTELPAASRPAIAFDCGTEDELIQHNRDLHEHMDALGIEHIYREHPGGHTWDYWDLHVQEALARHAEVRGVDRVLE